MPDMQFDQGATGQNRPADIALGGWGDGYPMFRADVAASLRIAGKVSEQWLPVKVMDYNSNYEVYNCIDKIGALVPEESELTHYKTSGRLSGIKKHVFDPRAIGDRWFFRDSFYPGPLYCTDRFVTHVLEQGWEGFWFIPVWDSEHEKFSSWPSRDEVEARPEIWGPEGIAAGYGVDWGGDD